MLSTCEIDNWRLNWDCKIHIGYNDPALNRFEHTALYTRNSFQLRKLRAHMKQHYLVSLGCDQPRELQAADAGERHLAAGAGRVGLVERRLQSRLPAVAGWWRLQWRIDDRQRLGHTEIRSARFAFICMHILLDYSQFSYHTICAHKCEAVFNEA